MTRALHISDDGSLHRYRTEIPNTIVRGTRGRGLPPTAKWLYVYLKSVAGDRQDCWQSTTSLAEGSGLGRGTVSRARRLLVKQGLIVVTLGERINRDTMHIRMVDIWQENMQEFAAVPQATLAASQCSTMERQCSTVEHQQNIDNTEEDSSGVPPWNSSVPLWNSGVPNRASKKISYKKIPVKKKIPLLSDSQNRTEARRGKYSPGFELFWDTWPSDSSRKEKKFYCYGLWRKHKLEARAQEVSTKVEAWKQTQKWRDGYEPQPSTWLNKRQFDDEVPGPQVRHRRGEHDGHRIANYPSGKYCKDCQREVLPRELAV